MTDEELAEYKRANGIKEVDVKKNEKIKTVYSNYANWIMIGLMMVVQVGISVLASVNGDIVNAFPSTELE